MILMWIVHTTIQPKPNAITITRGMCVCVCVCVATSNSKQHQTEAEAPCCVACSCTCMLVLLLSSSSLNMIHIYKTIMHLAPAPCTSHLAMAIAYCLRLGFWNRDPNHGHPDANQAGPGSEPSWTRIRTKQTRIRMGRRVRGLSFTMIMLFGVL